MNDKVLSYLPDVEQGAAPPVIASANHPRRFWPAGVAIVLALAAVAIVARYTSLTGRDLALAAAFFCLGRVRLPR